MSDYLTRYRARHSQRALYAAAMREWMNIRADQSCTCGVFQKDRIVNYKKHAPDCPYRAQKERAEGRVARGMESLNG